MRWQVFQYNDGYDYKNSISNGCFFALAARLGRYTGNSTYVDAANQWYDWSASERLIVDNYAVIDGITVEACSDHGHTEQWTYNVGVYLLGAAHMWNLTQTNSAYAGDADKWKERVTGFVNACNTFLKADPTGAKVLTEVICEPQDTCMVDGSTFKAYLARWMNDVVNVAPFAASQIQTLLAPSAPAAAQACTGPPKYSPDGATCGQEWYTGSFDGRTGIGMQMTALEVISGLLPSNGPVNEAQGISKSNPAAGSFQVGQLPGNGKSPILNITSGDKAGAAIITILLCMTSIVGAWWILK